MLKITVTKEGADYRATAVDVVNLMKEDPSDPDSPMIPTPMGVWNLRKGTRTEALAAVWCQHGQHYDIHPDDVSYEGCDEPVIVRPMGGGGPGEPVTK